jgi:hypothetical protein
VSLAAAAAFSTAWSDALLRPLPGTAPASPWGLVLFRICLLVDGAALLFLAWRPAQLGSTTAGPAHEKLSKGDWAALAFLTLLGLFLRLHRAGTDLWVDEIVNVEAFRHVPPARVVSSFVFANNHMLNTLLVKAMVSLAGEKEWAVRLPAILFGAASVPAFWFAGRRALGSAGTFLASLLLATSYHHVFFSQNARGYSAHMFFALAGTTLLARALRGASVRTWFLYGLTMLGGVASLLHGFFVLAGHACVLAVARLRTRPAGGTAIAGLRRGAVALFVVAYASFHLYALVVPDALASITSVYKTSAMGYGLFSVEHLQEWGRAALAAAGPGGLGAIALLALLAAAGFCRAQRADPVIVWGLSLPLAIIGLFVALGHLNVTPRTFLLALPVGLISAAAGVSMAATWVNRRLGDRAWSRAAVSVVPCVVAGGVSLAALGRYYAYPKQDFCGAMRFAESQRGPRDVVLAVYLAKCGYLYYGSQFGLLEGRDYVVVHSVGEIELARRRHPEARFFAVVTLARANRLEYPELDAFIQRRFRVVRRFPGTLGDGEVSVWMER